MEERSFQTNQIEEVTDMTPNDSQPEILNCLLHFSKLFPCTLHLPAISD